jgi:hypothetical protein
MSRLAPLVKQKIEGFVAEVKENPQLLVEFACRIEALPLPEKLRPATQALSRAAAFVVDAANGKVADT